MTTPLWLALILSVVAAIGIRLIEERGWLSGDAAIAVLLCSTLAIGLLILQLNDEVISSDVEGYLFGSVLLISDASLDLIVMNSTIAMVSWQSSIAHCWRSPWTPSQRVFRASRYVGSGRGSASSSRWSS